VVMFVTLICLIDLFINLVSYLSYEATMKQILTVSYYYIPKSFTFALPVSLLFAVAYTIGDIYSRNELTTMITSGIQYWRVTASFLVIGVFASIFAFYFEDQFVIPTHKIKVKLEKELKQMEVLEKNTNLVLKTNNGNRIYSIDYYDYENKILNGIIIVEYDDAGSVKHRINAQSARWSGEKWNFNNAIIYYWDNSLFINRPFAESSDYTENPEVFRRSTVSADELSAKDAAALVKDLQASGLPYLEAQEDLYHRYSFSAVSFIVIILSISMGGRFKKNTLLMTLLTSLICAVVFYVTEMVTMLLGKQGYISPFLGAWFPVFLFIGIGAVLVRTAKT
jgi:lipopolysaccharide export system permease protein